MSRDDGGKFDDGRDSEVCCPVARRRKAKLSLDRLDEVLQLVKTREKRGVT